MWQSDKPQLRPYCRTRLRHQGAYSDRASVATCAKSTQHTVCICCCDYCPHNSALLTAAALNASSRSFCACWPLCRAALSCACCSAPGRVGLEGSLEGGAGDRAGDRPGSTLDGSREGGAGERGGPTAAAGAFCGVSGRLGRPNGSGEGGFGGFPDTGRMGDGTPGLAPGATGAPERRGGAPTAALGAADRSSNTTSQGLF